MMTSKSTTWYATPTPIKIGLQPEQVRVSPLGNDAVIIVEIRGTRFEAVVPTATLGEYHRFVPAAKVGRNGKNEIIFLPTSNEGRPVWEISEEDLEEILAP